MVKSVGRSCKYGRKKSYCKKKPCSKPLSKSRKKSRRKSRRKSPLRRSRRKSPLLRSRRKSPLRRSRRKSPLRRSRRKSPLRRSRRKSPLRRSRRKSPLRRSRRKSNRRKFLMKSRVNGASDAEQLEGIEYDEAFALDLLTPPSQAEQAARAAEMEAARVAAAIVAADEVGSTEETDETTGDTGPGVRFQTPAFLRASRRAKLDQADEARLLDQLMTQFGYQEPLLDTFYNPESERLRHRVRNPEILRDIINYPPHVPLNRNAVNPLTWHAELRNRPDIQRTRELLRRKNALQYINHQSGVPTPPGIYRSINWIGAHNLCVGQWPPDEDNDNDNDNDDDVDNDDVGED